MFHAAKALLQDYAESLKVADLQYVHNPPKKWRWCKSEFQYNKKWTTVIQRMKNSLRKYSINLCLQALNTQMKYIKTSSEVYPGVVHDASTSSGLLFFIHKDVDQHSARCGRCSQVVKYKLATQKARLVLTDNYPSILLSIFHL